MKYLMRLLSKTGNSVKTIMEFKTKINRDMKRLSTICMAALLLMAVSCKKDKQTEVENAGSGFRATVECHAGDSKTHLDGKAVQWDANDAILVKSSTCGDPKRFTTAQGGASVVFDAAETLPENFYTPDYTAYYPASAFLSDQLTLSGTQTYVVNSFAAGANPMAAQSSDTKLSFKNVCGLLKLELYSETACNVANITLTSSNSDEMLWGTGSVILAEGIPSLGDLEDGGNMLILNCNGEPMSTESASPSSYFFVVPANTLGNGFIVKVTDTEGKTWMKIATASQDKVIVRSKITKMPSLQVATSAPVYETVDLGLPSGLLWATFNVGASSPEQFGDYFQWGGTTPLTSTDNAGWLICPFNDRSSDYNDTYFRSVKDEVCPDNVLALAYDAARAKWGGDWRMPTAEEWQELYDNTTHEWTNQNGVNGWLFTGNGQALFLPAAGCRYSNILGYTNSAGWYWSSSLRDLGMPFIALDNSFCMTFNNVSLVPQDFYQRRNAYPIRPVRLATR